MPEAGPGLAEEVPLRRQQLKAYGAEGVLLVEDLIETSAIEALRAEVNRLLQLAGSRAQHDALFDFEESHRLGDPRVRRIKEPYRHSDAFCSLMKHPRLLSVCRQLLRTKDLRHGDMKLNMKSAEYGSAVQWHQDWAFYPHTNDDLLAVGIFLDDVTPDNGPLLAVPGTHRGPVHSHHHKATGVFVGGLEASETGLDLAGTAQPLTGRAGSASFHHVRLVHGSDTNVSGEQRRVVFLEVAAADAWPLAGTAVYGDDFEAYHSGRMLCGKPPPQPRMVALPVRLPHPKPADPHFRGSIYAAQQLMEEPFFAKAAGAGGAQALAGQKVASAEDAGSPVEKQCL